VFLLQNARSQGRALNEMQGDDMETKISGWTCYHSTGVLICLVMFVSAGLIADLVFEEVPHLEDEVAYLFQAQVFAAGKAYVTAPFHTNCFFAPFVLDYEGRRFGKYSPGWPALLSAGVEMGQPWWVNAACAAVTVALIFRLGREMHDPLTGVLAAGLAVTSPFVLLLSGSMMSHPSCLAFVAAFLWCFWRCWQLESRGWAFAAGMMLGCAFTIRPFTALVIGLAAGGYLFGHAWRAYGRLVIWQQIWHIGIGFVLPALMVPVANAVWTGDPLLSPYVLFWPYDRLGFGPGHGPLAEGNTVWIGLGSAVLSVGHLANVLQGWPALSLIFVVLLFLFKPRRASDILLVGVALSLIFAYVLYWTNGDVFGPRYVYEASAALFVLSAAGIVRVGRWLGDRRPVLYAVLALLLGVDLFVYLPRQFDAYRGLYGVTSEPREILEQADLHHALVIVRDERGWKDYAVAFSMNAPTLDGDVVYANDCGSLNELLIAHYPGRSVYWFDGHRVQPGLPNAP
jgi:hypothetical protein